MFENVAQRVVCTAKHFQEYVRCHGSTERDADLRMECLRKAVDVTIETLRIKTFSCQPPQASDEKPCGEVPPDGNVYLKDQRANGLGFDLTASQLFDLIRKEYPQIPESALLAWTGNCISDCNNSVSVDGVYIDWSGETVPGQ